MNCFDRAKTAFVAGKYAQAVAFYEQAIAARPELSSLYQFNLNLARRRLARSSDSTLEGFQVQPSASAALTARAPNFASDLLLDDLYEEAVKAAEAAAPVNARTAPLVSVVMTAHNKARYIEAAITSILRQSWPKLELVVVDDASNDDTWTILQRLERSEASKLRCRRLNTRLGTGFARNCALTMVRGEFVFFQNADDLSHPERVRLSMQLLMLNNVVCVRGAHATIEFASGEIFAGGGQARTPAIVTVGLRRTVFDDIGFFNCTRNGSGQEYFERLIAYVAQNGNEIRDLDVPLYYRKLDEGYLLNEGAVKDAVSSRSVRPENSLLGSQYETAFRTKHRELGVDGFKEFFCYPVLRDLIPVAQDMSRLVNPVIPVVASLCSIPERADSLQQTLNSLIKQVDVLHIYLDGYIEVPDFVPTNNPRVKVYRSSDYPGLRDNGKFIALGALTEDCYYLTVDDDILYPPDYVAAMVRRVEHYGRQAVIGVHGVLVPERAERYFCGYRKVLSFRVRLERDALVNNLGTGTVAFHSALLRGLTLSHFRQSGMADLFLSVFCKQCEIPMIAIARQDDWLLDISSSSASLYQEFRMADDSQSALIRSNWPWGYAAICQAVKGAALRAENSEVGRRLETLIPDLRSCMR